MKTIARLPFQIYIYRLLAGVISKPFFKKMSFWEYAYRNQTYWEQTSGFEVLQEIKYFDEFQRDYEIGYYEREDSRGKVRKICKTLQTLLDTLELFPEHRKDLLEMFNFKMTNLKDPKLWENPKRTK